MDILNYFMKNRKLLSVKLIIILLKFDGNPRFSLCFCFIRTLIRYFIRTFSVISIDTDVIRHIWVSFISSYKNFVIKYI